MDEGQCETGGDNASPSENTTLALASSATCDRPFRFMDLPAELRCHVCEYLVVVGKVFYTPDQYSVNVEKRYKDWKKYRAPDLTVLRVSRKVHDEAEELYLSKNLFALPDLFCHQDPIRPRVEYGDPCYQKSPLFSKAASNHIKSISVSFNLRLLSPETMDRNTWELRERNRPNIAFDAYPAPERLRLTHDIARRSLCRDWRYDSEWLANFFGAPGRQSIRHLEVDVSNAYCQIGCYRLANEASAFLMNAIEPQSVTVLGCRNAAEEKEIMTAITVQHNVINGNDDLSNARSREDIQQLYKIQFDPEEQLWEEWKIE